VRVKVDRLGQRHFVRPGTRAVLDFLPTSCDLRSDRPATLTRFRRSTPGQVNNCLMNCATQTQIALAYVDNVPWEWNTVPLKATKSGSLSLASYAKLDTLLIFAKAGSSA
jgi:hypothetical protein